MRHRPLAHLRDQLLHSDERRAPSSDGGREAPRMAGIPRFQKGQRGAVADLADVIRSGRRRMVAFRSMFMLTVSAVWRKTRFSDEHDLGRVLDDDKAMLRGQALHLADESVGERRLAGTGAARDEDVFAVADRLAQNGRLAGGS